MSSILRIEKNSTVLFLGFTISGLVAFFTMRFFLQLVEKIGMVPFVAYRLALGVFLLLLV